MKHRKFWWWLIMIILITIMIIVPIYNSKGFQSYIINHSQTKIAKKITQKNIENANHSDGNYNGKLTQDANNKILMKNQLKANHVQPLGIMSIPAIKMVNPILNGYGDDGSYLALGACTMKPNQIMGQGNYALAGHYMKSNTIFHSLSKTQIGMNVYLTNLHHIYDYKVTNVQTIDDNDIQVINSTAQPTVTLITCVGLNATPYRTCVKGKLIKIIPSSVKNLKKFDLDLNR